MGHPNPENIATNQELLTSSDAEFKAEITVLENQTKHFKKLENMQKNLEESRNNNQM